MGSGPTISQQKLFAAAKGNPDLLEVLQQIHQVASQQQVVSGTTPIGKPAPPVGTPVRSSPVTQRTTAPIPGQASGSVSETGGIYTLQLVNPGGTSPLSQLQSTQAQETASSVTPLQAVRPIFHQIRVSTSPAFNVNSNTQTFGGNTGSTQTLWTFNNLGLGTWYFQYRSSYDGANWNPWKNANSGSGVGNLVDQVTLVSAAFSDWALFTIPGRLVMGIGAGILHDGSQLGIPAGYNLYSSGLIALAGPNGYDGNPNTVDGINACDVDIVAPPAGTVPVGIPDYPVEIAMKYQAPGYLASGTANVLGFCFNPEGTNVTLYEGPNSTVWAVFKLPGGARIAIGQGKNNDGAAIWMPSLSWISNVRMMSIATMTGNTGPGPSPLTGIAQCEIVGSTVAAKYLDDGGATYAGEANWMAIAWESGAPVTMVAGFPFLEISLQGGHSVVIGAGQNADGGPAITLPTGYSPLKMLSLVTPNGCENNGRHLRGIQECAMGYLTPVLLYSDNTNTWSGATNWMVAAWK